ncbi:MAG: AMP-binding protein, partial [Deltaproteobacteria bacterium]|nr:AMP-binding protein [Deltaproteobacteria bacterium]
MVNSPSQTFKSLVDVLVTRASQSGSDPYLRFLPNGAEEGGVSWSFAQLDQKARAAAAAILETGLGANRPVLLLLPPGEHFVAGFFGCLYAGAIAVPMTPPGLARMSRSFTRIKSIIDDSKAQLVISASHLIEAVDKVSSRVESLGEARIINIDQVDDSLSSAWQRPDIKSETYGWLQYTSGSTSRPKGVMVSHGNIVSNVMSISEGMTLTGMKATVSWLPPFHDMGLVAGILAPAYMGMLTVLMPPMAFLRRPANWFEAVARYRAEVTGGPNFAFDICAEKIRDEQLDGLDLSSIEVMFCGSEPVNYQTVQRFCQRFEIAGFKAKAFYPCYGLAENTLFATGVKRGQGASALDLDRQSYAAGLVKTITEQSPNNSQTDKVINLVSCGTSGSLNQVLIVDAQTKQRLNEGAIGEIWLGGPSVAKGYWDKPEASREAFMAYENTHNTGPYFRTGDLGFLLDGQLYISGRIKEMIIVSGRNFFPQDLEQCAVLAHEGLIENGAAAFGVEGSGTEEVVLVLESKLKLDQYPKAIAKIRRALGEEFDLNPKAILFVKRHGLPKTTSGKIQRTLCRQMYLEGAFEVIEKWEAKDRSTNISGSHISGFEDPPLNSQDRFIWQRWLSDGLESRLGLEKGSIDPKLPFSSLGLNSRAAVGLAADLEEILGRDLPLTLLYDYGHIEALSEYLSGSENQLSFKTTSVACEPIAIIGAAIRAPGAETMEAFSRLLLEGLDAITEIPTDRWPKDAYYNPDPDEPGCTNTIWGGFLAGVRDFDPSVFRISPREASEMDPQQRLLLEVSWEALERAGTSPDKLQGSRTGVFVGLSTHDYGLLRLYSAKPLNGYVGTGNACSVAANRLSYFYGLKGPSLAIDTACSSSLVALHLACRSLLNGESDMALAAGVNVILNVSGSVIFAKGHFMAPDGRCKAFDEKADGYVRSEGCQVVVLKRLSQAINDGDHILALVRGSAVNQDGSTNGLTAPSGQAQRAVILEALREADVTPSDIDYIEAHGTGTSLGDPIEINALKEVFGGSRPKDRPLVISSVKTNIGHLEAAAGLAGVIKALCGLEKEVIFKHLHLTKLNPQIQIDSIPAVIATEHYPWLTSPERLRRAGVSSFGFGGANAHVILEEWIKPPRPNSLRQDGVLTLSAMTYEQLVKLSLSYAQAIEAIEATKATEVIENLTASQVADVCYTTNVGRASHSWRLALNRKNDLTENLKKLGSLSSHQKPSFVREVKELSARRDFVF